MVGCGGVGWALQFRPALSHEREEMNIVTLATRNQVSLAGSRKGVAGGRRVSLGEARVIDLAQASKLLDSYNTAVAQIDVASDVSNQFPQDPTLKAYISEFNSRSRSGSVATLIDLSNKVIASNGIQQYADSYMFSEFSAMLSAAANADRIVTAYRTSPSVDPATGLLKPSLSPTIVRSGAIQQPSPQTSGDNTALYVVVGGVAVLAILVALVS